MKFGLSRIFLFIAFMSVIFAEFCGTVSVPGEYEMDVTIVNVRSNEVVNPRYLVVDDVDLALQACNYLSAVWAKENNGTGSIKFGDGTMPSSSDIPSLENLSGLQDKISLPCTYLFSPILGRKLGLKNQRACIVFETSSATRPRQGYLLLDKSRTHIVIDMGRGEESSCLGAPHIYDNDHPYFVNGE